MPVIVVGADTELGDSIVTALADPEREVRAFVSDAEAAERLRGAGIKVALGDLSDPTHVAGACTGCFTAVLVTGAADDGRQLAFADTADGVLQGWAQAVAESSVRRVIWVGAGEPAPSASAELATVDPALGLEEVTRRVVLLDDAATLPKSPGWT